MHRIVCVALLVSLVLPFAVYSQEGELDRTPELLYAQLEQIRARILDASAREGEIEYVPNSELLKMTSEEQRLAVAESSSRINALHLIREDGFKAAERLISELIATVLSLGTLEQGVARYPSNDLLKWIEGSRALSSEEYESIVHEAENEPSFFAAVYQEYDVGDERSLYVFNTLRAASLPIEEGRYRALPAAPFVVRKSGGEVILHRFNAEEPVYDDRAIGTFVGTLPFTEGAWPSMVNLIGPEGSGRYIRLLKIDVDEATDMLALTPFGEYFGGAIGYAFDSEKGVLHYEIQDRYSGYQGEGSIGEDKLWGDGYPIASTQGIHIPIRGAEGAELPMAPASTVTAAREPSESPDSQTVAPPPIPETDSLVQEDVRRRDAARDPIQSTNVAPQASPGKTRVRVWFGILSAATIAAAVTMLLWVHFRRKTQ